jgi:hypothetical protein
MLGQCTQFTDMLHTSLRKIKKTTLKIGQERKKLRDFAGAAKQI